MPWGAPPFIYIINRRVFAQVLKSGTNKRGRLYGEHKNYIGDGELNLRINSTKRSTVCVNNNADFSSPPSSCWLLFTQFSRQNFRVINRQNHRLPQSLNETLVIRPSIVTIIADGSSLWPFKLTIISDFQEQSYYHLLFWFGLLLGYEFDEMQFWAPTRRGREHAEVQRSDHKNSKKNLQHDGPPIIWVEEDKLDDAKV